MCHSMHGHGDTSSNLRMIYCLKRLIGRCMKRVRLRTTYPKRHRDWCALSYLWPVLPKPHGICSLFLCTGPRTSEWVESVASVQISAPFYVSLFWSQSDCRILKVRIILCFIVLCMRPLPELQIPAWLAGVCRDWTTFPSVLHDPG